MITSIPALTVRFHNAIRERDPFQLATPIHQGMGSLVLLPESNFTPIRRKTKMPIKTIAASTAPARKITRTPTVPELSEVMEALKKMKPSDALEVTMCKDTEAHYSTSRDGKSRNAAKSLAAALKRKFVSATLPYTAYTPDGKLVIVVKEK